MKSIAFHNLGCKVNAYEMEAMRQIVQKRGYKSVDFAQKADIYVINTCTVTNIADRKSRQMLHRAKQLNPDSVVVAAGCYAQTGLEELKKDLSVDIIIGNNHKTEIADILDRYFKEHESLTVVSELAAPSEYENAENYESSDRTRADVKIQDGCNQFCSYCAIPLARGRVRSRKPEDVIEEIKKLTESGHSEIVLTGIHIGSYGIDFDDEAWSRGECLPSQHEGASSEMMKDYRGESKLFDLIEMIDKAIPDRTKLARIRLGSLEPRIVTEENVQKLIKMDRVCNHFHMSLQSGCDTVLKRMNRHYTTEDFKNSIELLRREYLKAGKRVAITTDVIVGFPGETDEEFEVTRKYLEAIELYEMHIFKYSRRKNTVADRMPNQIEGSIKDKRSADLLAMTKEHSDKYRKQVIGSEINVLIEEKKDDFYIGHTEDYIKAVIPATQLKESLDIGSIFRLHANRIDGETVICEP